MKKHIKKIALLTALSLVMCLTTVVVFAALPTFTASKGSAVKTKATYGCDESGQQACFMLMWNEDGTFATKEAFEERFDAAVEAGDFLASDKDYFIGMYDYCFKMVSDGLCGRANGNGCGGGNRGMGSCGRR